MFNLRQEQLSNDEFNRKYYHYSVLALIAALFLIVLLVILILYQVHHRPLPQFNAVSPTGQQMTLTSYNEPNLLPNTLMQWASKAAVAAYTFDFVNYNKQASLARPYFTEAGWKDYINSVADLIQTIKKNQLLVNGVVSGIPVISNQGDLTGRGYVWRIQMPFLVTYQSSEGTSKKAFNVTITIVRVPTWKNPAAIGIDQFVMG
jgi:intracellular multiplication protein IcmL